MSRFSQRMRSLFSVGAQGYLIAELQTALLQKGFDPQGADGLFGRDTEAAIRQFQTAHAEPATGVVADATWTAITDTAAPDIEARCLQLTSTFEGHGYTLALGNWDGAWLTWGIIGFTLRHGEIQQIVKAIQQSAPNCVQQAFGSDADTLLSIMSATALEQESWANSITVGARVAEPWRTHFMWF